MPPNKEPLDSNAYILTTGQLVPNDKQVTFWNNSIFQTMEFSQQTGTSIHRNKQEPVTLMVLGIKP
jgi:hypothetical protein